MSPHLSFIFLVIPILLFDLVMSLDLTEAEREYRVDRGLTLAKGYRRTPKFCHHHRFRYHAERSPLIKIQSQLPCPLA